MKALVLIDFVNDMVGEDGKLAGKGYLQHAHSRGVPQAVAEWRGQPEVAATIHVGLEFRSDYVDAPKRSLLLGKAPEFGVVRAGGTGAAFVAWGSPVEGDCVVRKRRISPFFGTDLELVLRGLAIETVMLGGVATDLAVSSAARDAHDRDFGVEIISSICVAATEADHQAALENLAKLATIV